MRTVQKESPFKRAPTQKLFFLLFTYTQIDGDKQLVGACPTSSYRALLHAAMCTTCTAVRTEKVGHNIHLGAATEVVKEKRGLLAALLWK